MFFEVNLLCRDGKFAKVWIAANRGIRALTSSDVKSIEISVTSAELKKYIASESSKPNHRFSLALSSKLVHGLCLIHKQKVDGVYTDVLKMMINTPKTLFPVPARALGSETSSTTLQGRAKRKTPKKKPEMHSDDPDVAFITDQLEQLEQEGMPHVALKSAITMEEVEAPQPEEQPDEHMDIGHFEDFMVIAGADNPPRIIVEAVIEPRPKEAVQRSTVEKEAPEVEVEACATQNVEERVETVPEEAAHRLTEVGEACAARNVTEDDVEGVARNADRVFGNVFNFGVETQYNWKKPSRKVNDTIFVKIVRKKPKIYETEDLYKCRQLASVDSMIQEICKMFAFNSGDPLLEKCFKEGAAEIAAKAPVALEAPEAPVAPEVPEAPPRASTFVSSTNEPFMMTTQPGSSRQTPLASEFLPVFESTPVVGKSPPMMPPPPPIPSHETPIIDAELERQIRTDVRLDEDNTPDNAEQLQETLWKVIRAQQRGEMPLTLEQVAAKPLTKRSVVAAFGRLLTLHALRYVELISEENSTELRHINIGAKLRNL